MRRDYAVLSFQITLHWPLFDSYLRRRRNEVSAFLYAFDPIGA